MNGQWEAIGICASGPYYWDGIIPLAPQTLMHPTPGEWSVLMLSRLLRPYLNSVYSSVWVCSWCDLCHKTTPFERLLPAT